MTLTRESILALERHFVGALTAPSRTWLEPLPQQPLVFTGAALRFDGEVPALDLGTVSSPGEERHIVRVCNRGAERAGVAIEPPAWLLASWIDRDDETISLATGEAASVEVILPHDAEREFQGALQFRVGDRSEALAVRMIARRTHPIAQFDFNGAEHARRFDFGSSEAPYVLSVANKTSVPLVVRFADLPDWLTFEVDGRSRGGPIEGPFFERTAPFTIRLRPQHVGPHDGVVRMRTNDPRPELQDVELPFAAFVLAAKPLVRAKTPERVRLRADQTISGAISIENWGRSPARMSPETVPAAIVVREWPIVPAARDGEPGVATLPIRITPKTLGAGAHAVTVTFRVDGGDPARVDVPVQFDVDPPRRGWLRTKTIVALFAVLILTLLFVIARGMS